MEETNFTVTLPSNSNMGTHPGNRGNNYIVKLSSPLNFSGQTLNEDASWETSLTTVQYTNRFYDLRENCNLLHSDRTLHWSKRGYAIGGSKEGH